MSERNTLVVQISRGLAVASAIAQACRVAAARGWSYELIDCKPMVEAKELAVDAAMALGHDLVLVEDDIYLPDQQWPWLVENVVQAVSAYNPGTTPPTANFELRTIRGREGRSIPWIFSDKPTALWIGTCLMYVPLPVLHKLPRPCFEARKMHVDMSNHSLKMGGPRDDGRGSDVFFCWRLQEAGIPIRIVAHASVYDHPLRGTGPTTIESIP